MVIQGRDRASPPREARVKGALSRASGSNVASCARGRFRRMNRLPLSLQARSSARGALAATIVAITSSMTGVAHAQMGTSNGATATSGPTAVETPPLPRNSNEPQVSATGGDTPIHFVPASPDLVLSVRQGEVSQTGRVLALRTIEYYGTTYKPIYETVCEGDCTRTFALGTQRLALGKKGGTPTEAADPILVSGPSTLRGEYIDRGAQRTAGAVIGIVGGVGGLGVGGYELFSGNSTAIGLAGLGVMVTSLIVGSLLALAKDETFFTLTPLATGAAKPLRESGYASAAVQRGGLSLCF